MGYEGAVKVADRLLYKAKQLGRNRVVWKAEEVQPNSSVEDRLALAARVSPG
jgi:hypothetical protein